MGNISSYAAVRHEYSQECRVIKPDQGRWGRGYMILKATFRAVRRPRIVEINIDAFQLFMVYGCQSDSFVV